MTDRVLRTIPTAHRAAIAGYSMGGFGAMNVALTQLRNYSVVESWEGFFNNLSAPARGGPAAARAAAAARVRLRRRAQDTIARPRRERAVGGGAARAPAPQAQQRASTRAATPSRRSSAICTQMLSFAGRALRS